jgi:uncharacterized protein
VTNVRTPQPPKPPREPRRFSARDGIIAVAVTALILLIVEGPSIRNSGERMDEGLWRTVVLAIGKPADALGDVLPLPEVGDELTGWLSPDDDSGGPGSFDALAQEDAGSARIAPITPDYFDPRAIGEDPPAPRELDKVLVTGDSMSMPLDAVVARQLEGDGIEVVRDPQVGTGISAAQVGDWGSISVRQTREEQPDAIVIFIGANEGFPMDAPGGGEVQCCGSDWAAVYASRVRRMMDTYRQGGEARVYWLTLPMPRDGDRQEVARVVNAAIGVGAQPYRVHVRVLDMVELFTPGGEYRDSMDVDGDETIVRESDGVHLNEEGAEVAAGTVLDALADDFDELGD